MSNGSASGGYLLRGILLRGQGRYQEASESLGKAIEADPDSATAYAELALCLSQWGGHGKRALEAIDKAISLDPANVHFLASKGWILICLRKYEFALEVSKQALALAPLNLQALNVQVNAYTQLREWKKAEAAAQQSLSIEADDTTTLNLLAQVFRLQGRIKESREVVRKILSLLPNDAFGQANAGFGALEVGDYSRANEHFMDALRLDPHCEIARRGLLDSLRARVWIFRLNLYLSAFHRRRKNGEPANGLAVVSGFVLLFILGILWIIFAVRYPSIGAALYAGFFLCFQLGFLSYPTGNIFLLFDPVGKNALAPKEKRFTWCFALFLIVVLLIASVYRVWWLCVTMMIYLGIFAFSMYYPLIMDRLLLRMANQDEIAR